MTLTDQEYNFLMELSARTKMDCCGNHGIYMQILGIEEVE